MTITTVPMKEYQQVRIDGRLIAGGDIRGGYGIPNQVKPGDLVIYGEVCAHDFIAYGSPEMLKKGDFFVPGTFYQVTLERR